MVSGVASEVCATIDDVWRALASVADPEIPVLSIVDLGIVRTVERDASGRFVVRVTPTYSGCPATEAIRRAIRETLDAEAIDARVDIVLSPPWTTDAISADGRRKLAQYGIAPPAPGAAARIDVAAIGGRRRAREPVVCPHCGSHATRVLAPFGSTPCKALMRCDDCREPFDWFKPH